MDPVNHTMISTNNCNQDLWAFLPGDVLHKIVNEFFNYHIIKQVYRCGLVSKRWKMIIENNCDHIFKKAKEILRLKEEKGKPTQLLVFEGIQALRQQCRIGDQKLNEVISKHTSKIHISITESHLDIISLKKALEGCYAHRLLACVEQSTWNDIKQYIPILKDASSFLRLNAFTSDSHLPIENSVNDELRSVLIQALSKGFFNDAMDVYKRNFRYGNKFKEAILYYCFINQQFDQAEKFCTIFLESRQIAKSVFATCRRLIEGNNLEIVKYITSTVLPWIENQTIDLMNKPDEKDVEEGDDNETYALQDLFWIFCTYIMTRNFEDMNELLTKNPELADDMLDFYRMWNEELHLPKLVWDYLDNVVNETLSKKAKILDQTFHKMTQKLNKNTGLKRSNPFDNAVNDLETSLDGLEIQLMLYKFGKSNWSDVQKYIPVVTKGSHAQGFKMNDRCLTVLKATLTTALDNHFDEDAMTIYRETLWKSPYIEQGIILLHYFRKKEFERAEQFIKKNDLSDLDVIFLVLWICGCLFQDEDRYEEAEQIATKQLPSRAKKTKDTLHTTMHAYSRLIYVLYTCNFTRLNEYLSNNQVSLGEDFAQLIIMVRLYYKTMQDVVFSKTSVYPLIVV